LKESEYCVLENPVLHTGAQKEITKDTNPQFKIPKSLSGDVDPLGNSAAISSVFSGTQSDGFASHPFGWFAFD
jgi:hypothetical protein